MPVLSTAEFTALFEQAEHSLLRWECRRSTDVPDERAEFADFRAGRLPVRPEPQPDGWTRMVARHVAAGRNVRRVRVVDEPPTAYQRYMTWWGQHQSQTGEDLRYLARGRANGLDLPDHDFWVLDTRRVIELRFTADGRPLQHHVVEDADIVAQHGDWVGRAFAAATPGAEYLAEDLTRAWPCVRLGAAKGA